MFDFLKTLIDVQVKDIEADLYPTPDCQFGGKADVEFEASESGRARLEISIKHTSVPDGTHIDVFAAGNFIDSIVTQGGRAKKYLEFGAGETLPVIELGDSARIEINGHVCYRGEFHLD